MNKPNKINIITAPTDKKTIFTQLSLTKIRICIVPHIMPYLIPQWIILPKSLPLITPALYKPPTTPKAKS